MKTGVLALLLALGSCASNPPVPTPTPTPPPPPTAKYTSLLLRTEGVRLIRPNQTTSFSPFGAVQCCEGTEVNGAEINTLWPLASESWMDYTKANMFHFRMGPFFGDADHESEWAEIGGPYIGWGPEWNPAFWAKVVKLVDYAGQRGANVEVNVIDTWYCKHAQWGDQQMPWPEADIQACGHTSSPEQERYIRKVVSTLNDFANVIWITDNEGGEISHTQQAWYEWVASVIRDEEQKGEFKIVRLIGTNNTAFANGPFDYVATHARAALVEPIAGKHTENNERNPQFSKEQEFANYCKAKEAGLNYWFWRAGMSQEDADWLLEKMRQGCGGEPIGCFPPADDDPAWQDPPVGGAVGDNMRPALEAAKAAVGERCGATAGNPPTVHEGALATLDLLGAELRRMGYCAGRATDSVFIQNPQGKWQEFHAVAFSTGCYANDPALLPKNTWTYLGATSNCPGVPTVDEILCREHQSTNHIWDCTPKADGQPIRPEGDPARPACEREACGGNPTFTITSDTLTLIPRDNPYQFKIAGTGIGILHGTCPATGSLDLVGGKTIIQ